MPTTDLATTYSPKRLVQLPLTERADAMEAIHLRAHGASERVANLELALQAARREEAEASLASLVATAAVDTQRDVVHDRLPGDVLVHRDTNREMHVIAVSMGTDAQPFYLVADRDTYEGRFGDAGTPEWLHADHFHRP